MFWDFLRGVALETSCRNVHGACRFDRPTIKETMHQIKRGQKMGKILLKNYERYYLFVH